MRDYVDPEQKKAPKSFVFRRGKYAKYLQDLEKVSVFTSLLAFAVVT